MRLRDKRPLAFGLLALALLLLAWGATRTAVFARGRVMPLAVFFDLVVVLPGLFVLLVLRPAKRQLLGAAPILALGALAAEMLLGSRPEMKTLLRAAGALTELGFVALLVQRLRTGARQFQDADGDDLLIRVCALTDPVLRVLGLELAVFYYAFLGPRAQRPLRPGTFTYNERSGVGGVLLALGLITSVEGLVAHMLVSASSPRIAWCLTGLDVYALIWFVAAFRAARLRPVVVSADRLLVRTSLLWTASIPRDAIANVTPIAEMPRGKGILRAALGTSPELLVTLTEPVVARGLMGLRKSVTRVALYVDEAEELRAALDAR